MNTKLENLKELINSRRALLQATNETEIPVAPVEPTPEAEQTSVAADVSVPAPEVTAKEEPAQSDVVTSVEEQTSESANETMESAEVTTKEEPAQETPKKRSRKK